MSCRCIARCVISAHRGLCSNAIKVVNIGGTQVGHIPRTVAARLAPLMDRKIVTVEGVMLEGNRKHQFLGT